MTTTPKPIRIAIVLNGQEFICQAVMLPFSLEGYPPVEIVLYGSQPETPARTDRCSPCRICTRNSSTSSWTASSCRRRRPIFPRTGWTTSLPVPPPAS